MNNYFADRTATDSGYLNGYINALTNSLSRARYYETTNDERFLNESKDWMRVADIYLREIIKYEPCY